MDYRRVPPPPALRRWIRAFTYWDGGPPTEGRVPKTASRAPSLQIDVYDDELRWYDDNNVHTLSGVALGGVQSRPFAIDAGCQVEADRFPTDAAIIRSEHLLRPGIDRVRIEM